MKLVILYDVVWDIARSDSEKDTIRKQKVQSELSSDLLS